jgi:poly-gamma-glutamate capsule biosynthesis protein CapA/YwtB (metallophosphatase superfamily)
MKGQLRALTPLLFAGALSGCGDAASNEPTISVAFAGDILLDSAPGKAIQRGEDPFAKTEVLFRGAALRVGNLECPVATSGAPVEKVYTFRADPRVLPVLRRHFDAVSVANNHSGDYGVAAFSETLQRLDDAHVLRFGGGKNLAQAHAPLLVERGGIKIALLGYDRFIPRSFEAGDDQPGVAWAEPEQATYDIAQARAAGADVVIPFLHWGWENEPEPCADQRKLARQLLDAGADAVIGAHPHVTQGAEMYRGKPIIYSLGNFVFDLLDFPENARAWVLRLELDRRGVVSFSTAAVHIDTEGIPAPDPSVATPCGSRRTGVVSTCRAPGG